MKKYVISFEISGNNGGNYMLATVPPPNSFLPGAQNRAAKG